MSGCGPNRDTPGPGRHCLGGRGGGFATPRSLLSGVSQAVTRHPMRDAYFPCCVSIRDCTKAAHHIPGPFTRAARLVSSHAASRKAVIADRQRGARQPSRRDVHKACPLGAARACPPLPTEAVPPRCHAASPSSETPRASPPLLVTVGAATAWPRPGLRHGPVSCRVCPGGSRRNSA